jgi:cell division septation protein DedD
MGPRLPVPPSPAPVAASSKVPQVKKPDEKSEKNEESDEKRERTDDRENISDNSGKTFVLSFKSFSKLK